MLDRRNSIFFIKIKKIIISMTCKSLVSSYQFLSSIESSLFLRNKGENILSGIVNKHIVTDWSAIFCDYIQYTRNMYKVILKSKEGKKCHRKRKF